MYIYQISRASGFKAFQPEKKKMLYFQVCGIFMKQIKVPK